MVVLFCIGPKLFEVLFFLMAPLPGAFLYVTELLWDRFIRIVGDIDVFRNLAPGFHHLLRYRDPLATLPDALILLSTIEGILGT